MSESKVHSPNHYCLPIITEEGKELEVIDIIEAVLSPEEFKGFLKGNMIKYLLRESKKNGVEDIQKLGKYLDYMNKETGNK